MATHKGANKVERVQITLDPFVATILSGIEARQDYGETKKEIVNQILLDWIRPFMEKHGIDRKNAEEWSREQAKYRI